MSCVDPERRSFKVAESIYLVWLTKEHRFKVAESIYHVWLTKQKVLKFWFLYVMCGSRKKEF